MWTSVLSVDGRLYYWNEKTGEVRWEVDDVCHKSMLQSIQICESLQHIHINKSLQTCIRIGIECLLKRALQRWRTITFLPPEVRVKTIVACLNSWFHLKHDRDVWKRLVHQEIEYCERDMDAMKGRISTLLQNLAIAKVDAATSEYGRLQSNAKCLF